jgi:hypothetical protein
MTTKQVWNYNVQPGEFEVNMPRGAHVLTVHAQHGEARMWALVDPEESIVKRRFVLVCTGYPIENAERVRYFGTFQARDSGIMWHLFERVKGG